MNDREGILWGQWVAVVRLVDDAKFRHSGLNDFIRKSLRTHFHGYSVIEHLHQLGNRSVQRSEDAIRRELARERSLFRDEMTSLWSAAGGTIRFTHCREAWQRFVQKIEAQAKRLYPPPQGAVSWNVAETERWILDIVAIHRKVADKGDVKHDDRRHADKGAARIAELATSINNLMRDLHNAQRQQIDHLELILPTSEAISLTSSEHATVNDALERLFIDVLKSIVGTMGCASSAWSRMVDCRHEVPRANTLVRPCIVTSRRHRPRAQSLAKLVGLCTARSPSSRLLL